MRGEHSGSSVSVRAGFIPACAGNASTHSATTGPRAVHPRVRGEHLESTHYNDAPPRRFIPACAGNTWRSANDRRSSCPGSSPRARGTRTRMTRRVQGSSPRARTPGSPVCFVAPVHPRVRGEHASAKAVIASFVGSSPRARGTPESSRIRPTIAGSSPRARGTRPRSSAKSCRRFGSSPRARGTPQLKPWRTSRGRFIPACAGNTKNRQPADGPENGSSPRARGTLQHAIATRRALSSVHPRVRGEHPLYQVRKPADFGSSPRARGTLPLKRTPSSMYLNRFIPACAGNTGFP